MSDRLTWYQDRIKEFTARLQLVRRRSAAVSLLRLAGFFGLLTAGWYLLTAYSSTLLVLTILLLLVFSALVNWFLRLKDRRNLLEKLRWVNSNEAAILQNEPNGFSNGQEFLTGEGYLDDLDIFGRRSLYHLLNRTSTSHGRDRLSGLLRQSPLTGAEISAAQEAVRQLTGKPEERQLLTAHGLLHGEEDGNLHSLTAWLEMPSRLLAKSWLLVLRWALPAYNVGAIFFYLATDNYAPLLIGIAAAWTITGPFVAYISGQHQQIGKKEMILAQYAAILRIFHSIDPGPSAVLQDLQARTGEANRAIGRLSRLSSFFDQRLNVMVNILLNSLFLFDLHIMIALERWKKDNRSRFPGWISAVGNIECLNSLATFAFNNPEFTWPIPVVTAHSPAASGTNPQPVTQPSAANPQATSPGHTHLHIEARHLAHPLIPAAERVPNDFSTGRDERLILVTGSNMSGKTTFLRTIGVNLLLAQCGAPVCATEFRFTPMQLLTSLRVSDSLQEHTSYFMAELKKLQRIIHQLRSGQPSLVLIDEILRGTNSEDKTHGSEKFILHLIKYNCLSLFATHDLSLGLLAESYPGVISNYCFESIIEHGELHFNYKLQPGIARNRNASFLMEKMEII